MYNTIDIVGGALIAVVLVVIVALHKKSNGNYSLDKRYFQRRWTRVQKMCIDKKLWYKAIIDADELLDEALRQRHFKGKSTGERLVSAQHYFSSNDSLWFSHKLTNKIRESDMKQLSKQQTIETLSSFRLALKDIGALNPEKKSKTSGR